MGIFIKFECDKCGEYECDHSYEERMGNHPPPVPHEWIYSKSEPFVAKGDVICFCTTDTGDIIDEALVTKIDEEGKIWCIYLDGQDDGAEVLWKEERYKKVCSVIEEKFK